MEIKSWMIAISIFILGLVWKASDSHSKINILVENDETNKKRINALDKEQTKIVEALDRSFVSRELVYANFVTMENHAIAMKHLEEKLISKIDHSNDLLTRICETLEKKSS